MQVGAALTVMTEFSKKLFVKWNDFQMNMFSFYQDFRNDGDFSYITLVCDDGQQIEGHRMILQLQPILQHHAEE